MSRTLNACRKCHVLPEVTTVRLDRREQLKCSCPKCGLALYTPLGVTPDAVERWNAVNDGKLRPSPTAPRRSRLVSEADLGAFCPSDEEDAALDYNWETECDWP